MIESIICHNINLWWPSISETDKKALNRISKQATKVTKTDIAAIDDLYCKIITIKNVYYIVCKKKL